MKKDIKQSTTVNLLSKGTTEDMLMEYADQVFNEKMTDPLTGIKNDDHSGFALAMEDGLEFMYIRSKISQDMTLIRKSHDNKDLLAIYFFYGSTFDYYVENKIEKSIQGLINGIIIHNYSSNVRLSLLKDREFNFVAIRLNRMTLDKYFQPIADNLKKKFFSKKPILLYENLDQNMLDHLRSVGHIQSIKTTASYLILGKSIELLALTFNLILTRNHDSKIIVKIPEYHNVVLAKNFLISDWKNPPSIQQLSKFMGICPTKAKILFKQVYGYPPHKYFKKKKMEMAYQLIQETNYDITEIGSQLGYRSRSHFSADFKKYYGTPPKKYSMQKTDSPANTKSEII